MATTAMTEEIDNTIPVRLMQPIPFNYTLVSSDYVSERAMESVEQWAIFEYDKSLPMAIRHSILSARLELVYSENWVADFFAAEGGAAWLTDLDGTIVDIVPLFSEVFPYWDYYQIQDFLHSHHLVVDAVDAAINMEIQSVPSTGLIHVPNGSVGPVALINWGSGIIWDIWPQTLNGIPHARITLHDLDNRVDVVSFNEVAVDRVARFSLRWGVRHGARFSTTHSVSGTGIFQGF